jgi:hypothetical protein
LKMCCCSPAALVRHCVWTCRRPWPQRSVARVQCSKQHWSTCPCSSARIGSRAARLLAPSPHRSLSTLFLALFAGSQSRNGYKPEQSPRPWPESGGHGPARAASPRRIDNCSHRRSGRKASRSGSGISLICRGHAATAAAGFGATTTSITTAPPQGADLAFFDADDDVSCAQYRAVARRAREVSRGEMHAANATITAQTLIISSEL